MTEAGDFQRKRALSYIREWHLSGCADSRAGRKGRLNIALRHGLRCYFLRNTFSELHHTETHTRSFPSSISEAGQWPRQPSPLFSRFLFLFPATARRTLAQLWSLTYFSSLLFSSFTFFQLFFLPSRLRPEQGKGKKHWEKATPKEARNNSTGREQREAWERIKGRICISLSCHQRARGGRVLGYKRRQSNEHIYHHYHHHP